MRSDKEALDEANDRSIDWRWLLFGLGLVIFLAIIFNQVEQPVKQTTEERR